MKKSANLLYIEDCIRRIQMKKDVDKNIKCIENALNREFGRAYSHDDGVLYYVSIINNKTGNFFGASVYPSEHTMHRLVATILEDRPTTEIVSEVWKRTDRWEVEIDSVLLYDRNLNASAGEILAVILHELGHVAFSNSVPQRVNKVIRTYKAIQSTKVKKILGASGHIKKKIMWFPVLAACSSKNFKIGSVRKEVIADDFAFRAGYGKELEQFIDKLLIVGGNSLINRTESEMEDDIRVFVQWSVENLTELQFRKNKLKLALKTELLRNPSKYTRRFIEQLKDDMFGRDDLDLYNQVVQEACLINAINRVIKEPSKKFFDKMNRVTPVKMRDLDIFKAEVSRVKTVDDKIFLLENLHDELDKVELALGFINKGQTGRVSQSKQTLESYKKEIIKLIGQTNNVEIKNEKFGLYIEYPAGYEG